jgi:hypothetical protein
MTTNTKILVGILLILFFGAGFFIGNYSAVNDMQIVKDGSKPTKETGPVSTPTQTGASPSGGTTVTPSNLTEGQIKLMKALGIDPTKVTITPTMVLCAETSLGAARVEEIKNGATPSMTEGVKLVACYK